MIQSFMYGSAPPIPDAPTSIIRRKNRRKRQTTEDGYAHAYSSTNGSGNGNGKEERQPLLPPVVVRDRSYSPEQIKRVPR